MKPVMFEVDGRMTYVAELAREAGVTRKTIRARRAKGQDLTAPNRKRRVNAEEVKRMALDGVQCTEMAKRLGTSLDVVRKAMRRHGVYRQWTLKRFKKAQA